MPERPLRLAYLSIGRHIHTERWLSWFARRGHDVHLMTIQPGPIPGVTVHDIMPRISRPKPLRYALGLMKVKAILRDLKPDLLHAHFLTGYGYWGVYSGHRPFVLTVWGDDVYVTPFESSLKNRLARKALGDADYITGDSSDILDACVELGANPERTEVIQWGVNFSRFHPDISGDPVRAELGIPGSAPVVLSTRSFTQPYYNIDVIVETATRVREKHPDVHYIMAGLEGDDRRFRDQAARAGVGDWMHWVGRIPHPQLAAYLRAATVFLSVPSVDATAVSLLEAMACRTAIVSSRLPSAMEWIEDGATGLLVSPRDQDELIVAIGKFLASRSLCEDLGRQAESRVREHADHDRNMSRVQDIYYSVVRGENPAPSTERVSATP